MLDKSVFLFTAGAVLVLAAIGWAAQRRVATALPEGAFNPVSTNNLAYQGVNAVGVALTGDRDFSLGAWLWEKTHSEPDPSAPVILRARESTPFGFWGGA